MAQLKKIVKFLNNYLKIKDIKDTSRNGLQVRGRPEASKIAFTENAGLDTFKIALKEKADLIVVHHGILWKRLPFSRNKWFKKLVTRRIKFLERNNLSLYAAHLPLDRHRTVGNIAQLIKLLGAEIESGFAYEGGKNVAWVGKFTNAVNLKKIVSILERGLKTKCVVLAFGNKKIKTIAVCSGGAGSKTLYDALNKKVDAYLTGEQKDFYTAVKDLNFNVIFAGHYATETVGVKALMPILKNKFKVKTIFIDDPTGL